MRQIIGTFEDPEAKELFEADKLQLIGKCQRYYVQAQVQRSHQVPGQYSDQG